MALRSHFTPVQKDITLLVPALSPAGRSKALAGYARKALRDAQEQNRRVLGSTPRHDTYVDRQKTENLDAVRPDGTIVFEFELHQDMFRWISDLISEMSPVGRRPDKRPGHPGLYKRSHIFVVDGVIWDIDKPIPPTAQEAFFANTTPYARKIENGLSDQAINGVYHVAAVKAAERFGNLARITYGHRSLQVGGIEAWAQTTAMTGKGRTKMTSRSRAEWLRRQPAVIITYR
jgi:hypothetical protein